MLEGKNLIFIRHERNTGVGKESNKPYDFANLTLSDGLESFKMPIEPHLTESKLMHDLKKGDKVTITVDVFENFNRTQFIVSAVQLGV